MLVKKLKVDIFTHAVPGKTLLQVLINPQEEGITNSPSQKEGERKLCFIYFDLSFLKGFNMFLADIKFLIAEGKVV